MNSFHERKVLFVVLLLIVFCLPGSFEVFGEQLAPLTLSISTEANPVPRNEGNRAGEEFSTAREGTEDESVEEPPIEDQEEDQDVVENDEDLSEGSEVMPPIGMPLVFNDAVDHYIHYFSRTKKSLFEAWLKRQKCYEPLVKKILREYGLPEDLIYLAMIESGFNMRALSRMKAAGPWQFIRGTGRRYGLVVNDWIDERLDIQKSTVAAARYLSELFKQFDCWHLVAAAYNAGENRIERLMKRHDTRDFWELRNYKTFPRETREYVPQLLAAMIIAKNPEKYGVDAVVVEPFEFVGEDVPGGVPLAAVAKAASADLQSVKTLNPELRRGITPPGQQCRVRLPVGTDSASFRNELTLILKTWGPRNRDFKTARGQHRKGPVTANHTKKKVPATGKMTKPLGGATSKRGLLPYQDHKRYER